MQSRVHGEGLENVVLPIFWHDKNIVSLAVNVEKMNPSC